MYKTKLQELCHKKNWDLPVYATVKDGSDHCPSFTTTIYIQGKTFETPKNVCKSSKESQNVAAKIAFDNFNSAEPQLVSPPGFIDMEAAKNNSVLQQQKVQNAQTSMAGVAGGQSLRDEIKPQGLHVYKNRLQHYAQKKNLTLPEYSSEIVGPPHARQFRASVKIDGSIYTSPVYCSNLKDSEHAAAKVAFDSLSAGEVQEQDEGLYKTLLQEFAQKKNLQFPSYTTITNGPPHIRTFVSTVEIVGESFKGQECRTKKLAEINAAKVAYNSVLEREAGRYFSPGDSKMGNTEVGADIQEISTSHGNDGASNAIETPVDIVAAGIATEPSKHGLMESDDAEKPTAVRVAYGSKVVVLPRKSSIKVPVGSTISPCSDKTWVAAEVKGYQGQ